MGGNCCNVVKKEQEIQSVPSLADESHAKMMRLYEAAPPTASASIPDIRIFKVHRALDQWQILVANSLRCPESTPVDIKKSKRQSDFQIVKKPKKILSQKKMRF